MQKIMAGANTEGAEKSGVNWKGVGRSALEYAPTAINALTGIFGKNTTGKPTEVKRTKVGSQPINYNINPYLEQSGSNYRAILANPNASANERLAALSQKNRGDSGAFAKKSNVEMQMKEQRNARQAGLDANRNAQQASLNERNQVRAEKAAAQLGITGNIARQSYSEISRIIQQKRKDKNLSERDKQLLKYLETYYGTDPEGTGGQQSYTKYLP
jgi:hypothetical protein